MLFIYTKKHALGENSFSPACTLNNVNIQGSLIPFPSEVACEDQEMKYVTPRISS